MKRQGIHLILKKEKEYYWHIQEILAHEQPYTFLYVPDVLHIVHARFKGIEPALADISYNFIKWYA